MIMPTLEQLASFFSEVWRFDMCPDRFKRGCTGQCRQGCPRGHSVDFLGMAKTWLRVKGCLCGQEDEAALFIEEWLHGEYREGGGR